MRCCITVRTFLSCLKLLTFHDTNLLSTLDIKKPLILMNSVLAREVLFDIIEIMSIISIHSLWTYATAYGETGLSIRSTGIPEDSS